MMDALNKENWDKLLELAKNGDSKSQYELACYLEDGKENIVEQNFSEAFEWYKKAYENGNIDATVRFADFLSEGINCKQDIDLAIKLYNIGIENGSSIASIGLATIYRDKQDFEQAFKLYTKTQEIEKTYPLALALCYYYGIGTTEDKNKAMEIFLNISNDSMTFQSDIDEANYYLGKIYLEGKIVAKSLEKARYYLGLANTDNDHSSTNELLLLIGRNT
jgi:TPR repeat protein